MVVFLTFVNGLISSPCVFFFHMVLLYSCNILMDFNKKFHPSLLLSHPLESWILINGVEKEKKKKEKRTERLLNLHTKASINERCNFLIIKVLPTNNSFKSLIYWSLTYKLILKFKVTDNIVRKVPNIPSAATGSSGGW